MKFSMLLVSSSPPKTPLLIIKKYRNTNIRIVTRIFKRIIIIFQNHFPLLNFNNGHKCRYINKYFLIILYSENISKVDI